MEGELVANFFMHGISYRPTDLSLLKEFSKKISFKDCPEAVVHVCTYII